MSGENGKVVDFERAALAQKLVDLHAKVKADLGERWEQATLMERLCIGAMMEATGETNPLTAVKPLVKKFSAAGIDPMMWMVTAVDLQPGMPEVPKDLLEPMVPKALVKPLLDEVEEEKVKEMQACDCTDGGGDECITCELLESWLARKKGLVG